jgi:hypothetical protein
LGRFLKIAEASQILGLLFSTTQVMYELNLTKNWRGHTLGEFFADSSGHPDFLSDCFFLFIHHTFFIAVQMSAAKWPTAKMSTSRV